MVEELLHTMDYISNVDFIKRKLKNRLSQEALAMEKEQHQKTFQQSRRALDECMPPVWESWEQYYSENFSE